MYILLVLMLFWFWCGHTYTKWNTKKRETKTTTGIIDDRLDDDNGSYWYYVLFHDVDTGELIRGQSVTSGFGSLRLNKGDEVNIEYFMIKSRYFENKTTARVIITDSHQVPINKYWKRYVMTFYGLGIVCLVTFIILFFTS